MHARSRALVFVSTSIFLTGAVMGARQEGRTAEQAFKNIQVFKGADAGEILPAMQMMSASLGVDCEYCHVQGDNSSDGKETKKTARKMVLMMRDIDDKNFHGAKMVTCASCHHGSPNVLTAPGSLNMKPFVTGEAKDAKPNIIIDRYVDTIGGRDAVRALASLRLKGTYSITDGPSTQLELLQAAPDKFVATLSRPDGTQQRQGTDGTVTWLAVGKQVRPLAGSIGLRIQRPFRVFRNMDSLPKYDAFTWAGTETLNGKTENVLIGKREGGKITEKLYFNDSTNLLDRAVYFTDTLVGDIDEVFDYSDYRPVAGVKIPFRVEQETANGKTIRQQFDHGEPNVRVDDAAFRQPGA